MDESVHLSESKEVRLKTRISSPADRSSARSRAEGRAGWGSLKRSGVGEARGHDPSNLSILSHSDVGFLNLLETLVRTFTLCILQITPDFMPHHDQSQFSQVFLDIVRS